jgi:hypothetical protein
MCETPKPLLPDVSEQLTAMRKQLKTIFDELHIVLDVSIICYSAAGGVNFEFSPELATLLRVHVTCGIDDQMRAISRMVEALGGKTEYTEDETPNVTS